MVVSNKVDSRRRPNRDGKRWGKLLEKGISRRIQFTIQTRRARSTQYGQQGTEYQYFTIVLSPFVLQLIHSFITYRPVPHLDRKHTVFGKVVGGLEILDKLEAIPTDHDEKPEQDIKINKLLIFVDPFDVILFKCAFLNSRSGKRNGRIRNLMNNRKRKMPKKQKKTT
jgi:hypothetical protein